jgi:hypothetical protein
MGRPIGGLLGRPMAIKKERKERKKVNKVCICRCICYARKG